VNSATVPVIPYLEHYYNADCEKEEVAFGAVSTEHFVMCSNSAKDTKDNPDYEYADIDPHRERVFIKRALTELYPNTSFSCVSDSYDYWNVVKNILPTLKDEILAHNGCLLVRGDSGDCVKVVTETVFELWKTFGGTVNSKGYKVLDSHVKALYGDSITVQRAERIYSILEQNGFAASNVSLGVGSFSMHCIEEEDEVTIRNYRPATDGCTSVEKETGYATILKPFTRDTFSMAIKAVYAEFQNEDGTVTKMPVYKDPKTDREAGGGNFKKSQRGCVMVSKNNDGTYSFSDGYNWDETDNEYNALRPIFRDGKMLVDENLQTIRERLNNNNF
jgi:nicotinamide phosphoribosyltransferase